MSALEPGEPPWGFRKPPRSPHVCPGSSTAALGVLDAAQGVPTSALGARVPPWGSLMPPGGPHVYLGASSLALGVPDAAWGSSRLPWRLEFPRGRPGSHPGVTASNLGGWSPTLGVPDVAEESPRLLLGLETCSGGSRTPPRLWRRLLFRTGEAPGSRRSPLCPHRPFPETPVPGLRPGQLGNGNCRRVSVWEPVPFTSSPTCPRGTELQAGRATNPQRPSTRFCE
nr:uncharacterized protein LOC129475540 [Symphalangus syndactylus]